MHRLGAMLILSGATSAADTIRRVVERPEVLGSLRFILRVTIENQERHGGVLRLGEEFRSFTATERRGLPALQDEAPPRDSVRVDALPHHRRV